MIQMKKTVLTSLTIPCLLSTMLLICLTFNIQPVEAGETIYIRATGEVEGTDAIHCDGDIYALASDINDEIVVEKSNIIIDGNGYSLQGNGSGSGFRLYDISNVTIQNCIIKAFSYGIRLKGSLNNTISGNSITDNGDGILLYDSSKDCSISGNHVANNSLSGIRIGWGKYSGASNTSIIENNITNNESGIVFMAHSDYNSIYGNNILGNSHAGIQLYLSSNNNVVGNSIMQSGSHGVSLSSSCINNSIYENNIRENTYRGIWLTSASEYNIIAENNITENSDFGIWLDYSSYNTISRNNITANKHSGIKLTTSSNYNSVYENNIIAHEWFGILLEDSSNNTLHYNNFIDNTQQVYDYSWDNLLIPPSINIWDDRISKGNYWSEYKEKYPDATEIDGSGIWDTPYIIDENNQDNYPIVPEFPSFLVLPVFMISTLLVAILYRRKHSM